MYQKVCRACRETKPAEGGFYRRARCRDGFVGTCKACLYAQERGRYQGKGAGLLEPARRTRTERRSWGESDLEWLTENYPRLGQRACSEQLGRSVAAVSMKARQLGVGVDPVLRPRTGPALSEESRRKISESLRGRKVSDEQRRAIGERTRQQWQERPHPRGMAGKKHSPETLAKVSAAASRYWASVTPMELEARRIKANTTKISRYGTAGSSFLISDNPYSRTKGGRRADLDNRYFRSAWEANYARYLNFRRQQGQITGWEYEAETFVFPGITRGAVTYTPDFRVTLADGTVEYHEVKGWLTSRARQALKRMKKHFPDVYLLIIGEAEYKALLPMGALFGFE